MRNRIEVQDITEKEISKVILAKKNREKNKLSKKEYDERIANWQLFYLNNLDIFTEEYLQVQLKHFQRQMLLDCRYYDQIDVITSRGLGKTLTTGILANNFALLLPGINILITSYTLAQGNLIINEKIDDFLSSATKGVSPVLKQLRKDGYIKFTKDPNSGGMIVNYGNGSKIFVVSCGDSARGFRANIVILDEARLVKKTDYDATIEPVLEPYNFNGFFMEPKQIILSSAKTKDNWLWKDLRKKVSNHYKKNEEIKYGFFAGDIITAVANGIQTKNQYRSRKENTNELDFEMEYENLWLGESKDSLYKYEDFHANQVLNTPFYFLTNMEYAEGKQQEYVYKDNEIRFISMDIAVSSGRDNDNTVFTLGNLNEETKNRNIENISAHNGLNSMKQVVLAKRYFYEYKASFFVMDSKGVGNPLYDIMTVETYDEERDVTYPAWTVCNNKYLQISSDNVVNDKINRTMSNSAEEVIIPYAGTPEINSTAFLSLRKNLRDGKIKFLRDDAEVEAENQGKIRDWIKMSAEKKALRMLPFLETRFMINESVALNVTINGTTVKLKEDRSAQKDRFSSLNMFNYFSDKLLNKLMQDNQSSELDMDAWASALC